MLSFAQRLITWQKLYGRHDLPWQGKETYRVWLSEIMLQQTQVTTVIPYYKRFVNSFPTLETLAAATEDQVLTHWSGLGYYARGRNLHKTAKIIVDQYHGEFPRKFEQILKLPGIGRSTAAAICALACHERRAILDGNVKRLLARYCGIEGWTGQKGIEAQLWVTAEGLLPKDEIATYTQALMDMGARVCTRSHPKCALCPVQADCFALREERISEFPFPRPKKSVLGKNATFLMLIHGNDILLEKRPSKGIWGGLWCPPQFDDETTARDWFLRHKMKSIGGEKLEIFIHSFTHFKLHITPLKILLACKPVHTLLPGSVWIDVRDALGRAIPTPVRAMLVKVCQE